MYTEWVNFFLNSCLPEADLTESVIKVVTSLEPYLYIDT